MLKQLPRERDVVSFQLGMDNRGHMVLLKFVLKNGRSDVIFMPATQAVALAEMVEGAIRRTPYRDIRRRRNDPLPDETVISQFLELQPDFEASDWDAKAGSEPRQIVGYEVHTYSDALFIGFQMGAELYKVLRLDPAIVFYLAEMVRQAEKSGRMLDLGRAPTPTVSRN
jgi:hypothetical protein